MRLIARRKDGTQVVHGDKVVSFKGQEMVYRGATQPTCPGHAGKVLTDQGTYFATVFDLTVEEVES